MKNIIRNILLSTSLVVACAAYADTPSMNVTVSDPGGKVAFKGRTNSQGAFATSKLARGNYVVEFKGAAPKGSQWALAVAAGKKKVIAQSVAGEKFASGGVAMKVDNSAGVNITGQISGSREGGKPGMVWIPKQLGSNVPAHWAPADSAEAVAARNAGSMSSDQVQKINETGHGMGGG
jgi:hypothetical protein